ncbi:hypothetical protein CHARACLAT_001099 [Characodon lateralis]|uniref:Uncharacterized protein n=1 Tax=Characodon lateralis TaxID=208331 RepID=A0ABU7CU88_9TELE|nr:hypothetical protein [Characodon lateralis]
MLNLKVNCESKCVLPWILSGFICSIWSLTWYPGTRRREKKKENRVWAEEKPSILSVLKFDSELQDPGRQKANRGGGKDGGVNPHSASSDSSLQFLADIGLVVV